MSPSQISQRFDTERIHIKWASLIQTVGWSADRRHPLNLGTADVHACWTNEAEVHVVWVTLQDFASQNLRQKAVHVAQTFFLEVKVSER
jgi:hypothetical protein